MLQCGFESESGTKEPSWESILGQLPSMESRSLGTFVCINLRSTRLGGTPLSDALALASLQGLVRIGFVDDDRVPQYGKLEIDVRSF